MARTKATARKSIPMHKSAEKEVSHTFNDPSYGEFTTTLNYRDNNLYATTKLSHALSSRDERLFREALATITVSNDRLTLVREFDTDQEYERCFDLYLSEEEMEFVRSAAEDW